MSDEMWRRREREQRDPAEDFGGPLFPDADPAAATDRPDDTGERRLSFGPNDTGPLPHWTDPPTGEIPRMAPAASSDDDTSDDDVDVWSSFTTESPIWRDDVTDDPTGDQTGDTDLTGEVRADSLSEPMSRPADRARSRWSRRDASPAASPSAPTRPACPGARRRAPAVAAPRPRRAPAARPARRARRPSRHRRRATCRQPSAPASCSVASSSSSRCGAPPG